MATPIDRREALAAGLGGVALLNSADAAARPALPPATARREIAVRQGTNFAATPSPDGRRIAMDLAGMIWLLPVNGGKARPLTPPMLDASQPDWQPDSSGLVFQAYTGDNFQLWHADAGTGALRQLTSGPNDSREPAVSPDGQRVAYVSDRPVGGRGGRCRVHILNLETLASEPWADIPGEAAQPAWSADGRELVCATDGRRIIVSGADGATREVATLGPGSGPLVKNLVAAPAFAPDGKSLVWVEVAHAEARLRQSSGAPLVEGEDIFPFRPRWFANGDMLYTANGSIRRRTAAGTAEVPFEAMLPLSRRVAAPQQKQLAPAQPVPAIGLASLAPSPDGSQFAFRALNALWIMHGREPARPLVEDGYCVTDPAFAPDGRTLAFVSDRAGNPDIWLRAENGGLRQLTRHDGAVAGPAWSPDGGRIAFIDHLGGLFLCDVATGATRKLHPPLFAPGKPCFSADAATIALAALVPSSARFREGANQILLIDVASGRARYQPVPDGHQITTRGDDGPHWSPDGRHMAAVVELRLALWPVAANGTPTGALHFLNDEPTDCPRFTAGGGGIAYLSAGRLRTLPVSGGTPASIGTGISWAVPKAARPVVLRAGRMWDGVSRTLSGPTDIRIAGGAITGVAPASGPPPADAEFIDASGLTAMPGLVDGHVHTQMQGYGFGDREGRLWLAMGITSVRSLAGPATHMIEYREGIASGRRVGPRVFTTGEAIDGSRIFYHMMRPVTGSGQMALELERAEALSYDQMKCYVRLPAEKVHQVTGWAHRHGITATSHYLYPAMFLGIDALEHMGATNRLGYARSVSLTGAAYADVAEVLAATGAAHVPTLFQASALYRDDPALADDIRIQTLLPPWERKRLAALMRSTDEAGFKAQLGVLERNVAHLRRLIARGGLVVSGTDAPLDLLATSLHMNLRGMVRFGMAPVDALTTATRNAGLLLGERLGVIARGAHADISLVEGNPLARIEDAANVRMVVAAGIRHDIASLCAPFAAPQAAPVQALAAARPGSAHWWHEPAFVEAARRGCCLGHA